MSDIEHAQAVKDAAAALEIAATAAVETGLVVDLEVTPVEVTNIVDKYRRHRFMVSAVVSRPL